MRSLRSEGWSRGGKSRRGRACGDREKGAPPSASLPAPHSQVKQRRCAATSMSTCRDLPDAAAAGCSAWRRRALGQTGRAAEQWRSQEFVAGYAKQNFFEANTYNGHNKSMNITKVRVLNMDN